MTTLNSALRTRQLSRDVKLYFLLAFVIGFVTVSYIVQQTFHFMDKRDINHQFEQLSTDLERTKTQEAAELADVQTKNKDTDSSFRQQLTDIFPYTESYTELTRMLDVVFAQYNTAASPMISSDLRFGTPHLDETKQYNILPFSMTINASQENFYHFLAYVQNSGAFSGGKVRLMDVTSIHMNLQQGAAKTNTLMNFRVDMNAYFQKTAEQASSSK